MVSDLPLAWSMPRLLSQGFLGTVLQRGCLPCPKARGEGWPMALTPLSADAEFCIISILCPSLRTIIYSFFCVCAKKPRLWAGPLA